WGSSRGGMLSIVAAVLLIVALSRISTRGQRQRSLMMVVALAVGVLSVGVFVLASSEDAWQEVHGTDVTTKLLVAKRAAQMALSFPVFGTGRGAFESTFPAFRQGVGYYVYTHPENVVAQFLSEWGLPVSIVALGAIAFALRP